VDVGRSGRDSLEIELDARLSPSPWTAFDYVVSSHVDPFAAGAPP
jgi:hypothetical protein